MTPLLAQKLQIAGEELEGPLSGSNVLIGKPIESVGDLVNLAIIILFPLVLVVLFGVLLLSGLDMARNLGNEQVVKKAQSRLTNAVIGIILLAISFWAAQIFKGIFYGS
jgi:hypothetical protein